MQNKTWLDKEKLLQWLSKEGHYHEGDYYNAIDAVAGEILSGTFNAPEDYERLYRTYVDRYTETVGERNQLREELEDQKKAYAAAEKENTVRRDIMMQLREENAKLVKALEWIANGRMYGNEAADCARQALSELRGREPQ